MYTVIMNQITITAILFATSGLKLFIYTNTYFLLLLRKGGEGGVHGTRLLKEWNFSNLRSQETLIAKK